MFLRPSTGILFVASALSWTAFAGAGGHEKEQVAKAVAAVAEAERQVDGLKELAKQGAVPTVRVDRAEIELIEARIRLATLQGNERDVLDGLATLVVSRERRWEQAKQIAESGAIPRRRAGEARVELAEARIRLELHTIVAVGEQDFAEVQAAGQRGTVPERIVDDAREAVSQARDRLKSLSGETLVARADEIEPPTDKVRELLRERLVVLTEIHELAMKAFRGGQAGVDQVHQAKAALLAGRLELALTRAERLQSHQELVKQAEQWVKAVADLANAQEIPAADLLKAKVHFLEAQVALERLRASK